MNIAIIGAGLAGLTLANKLSPDHAVTVFEKARGPGGRMSTRRAPPFAFDHGAQYFTAESAAFQDFLQPLQTAHTVTEWPGEIELRGGAKVSTKRKFAATPGMNAICKHLAETIDVRAGIKVETLRWQADEWYLTDATGAQTGPFDWVVSTAPAPQTAALFPETFEGYDRITGAKMQGCFALMLGFDRALDLNWTALKSETLPVGWIAVNSQKPGRGSAYSLLIQSSNVWAEAHLEDDPDAVAAALCAAASDLTNVDLGAASHQALHRWRYAATQVPAGVPYLKDQSLQLAACGDWCIGGKVEAAFLSADALAKSFQ